MIEIKFAAANPAALRALIGEYLGLASVEAAPAGKPNKPKAEAPAETAKATAAASDVAAASTAAPAAAAATNTQAAAPATVTYDQIAAAVPKTAGLGPNAAAKVKGLMTKWGVVPPKKVKDAVKPEQYGEFLTELLSITND